MQLWASCLEKGRSKIHLINPKLYSVQRIFVLEIQTDWPTKIIVIDWKLRRQTHNIHVILPQKFCSRIKRNGHRGEFNPVQLKIVVIWAMVYSLYKQSDRIIQQYLQDVIYNNKNKVQKFTRNNLWLKYL